MVKRKHTLLISLLVIIMTLTACDIGNFHMHVFDEWSVLEDATCVDDGLEIRSCSCGYEETRVVEKTGNHKFVNGYCAYCKAPEYRETTYTYNTYYLSALDSLNPHTESNDAAKEIYGYTTSTLYAYDYNEARDGFVIVPEMAAEMPLDITTCYEGDEWGISDSDRSRAWLISLREDLKWQNGYAITAYDFEESVKRLLNSEADNENAESLYSSKLVISGAEDYHNSGIKRVLPSNEVYETYSSELDDELIFTLGPGAVECYVRTWMGFPDSHDLSLTVEWLLWNYGKYFEDEAGNIAFTPEAAALMEGKTIAEIKADPELCVAWESATQFAMALANTPIVWCVTEFAYPEVSFDKVGVKAISDTELVLILEEALDGFDLTSSLVTSLGLVHTATYDGCESIDENGNYTNAYGTSIDTYMSFGPYKILEYNIDGTIALVKNKNWYGYSDAAYAGQYQTTHIIYKKLESHDKAMEAFLRGEIDYVDLTLNDIRDYADSSQIYYYNNTNTFFIAMNPDIDAFTKWEEKNPGYNKSILTVTEFRKALWFALDRQGFINAADPFSTVASAIFDDSVCADPENGVMYRNTEAAKDALLEAWGISSEDIGEGKLFPTKDYAVSDVMLGASDKAKALFNEAYDKAVEAGIYNGTDTILITIGMPNNVSSYYRSGYEFLVNNFTEAVKGTKLEGKLKFEYETTLTSSFAGPLDSNAVNMLFGVGWGASALDPYSVIGAYTYDDYKYDPSAWKSSTTMMEFDIEGVTYEASILSWTKAIEGDTVEITNVKTGETTKYSCTNESHSTEERIRLLAALECFVLKTYNMIPINNSATASMLSYKVSYGSDKYILGVGYGGVRYLTYHYTDAEWSEFIKLGEGSVNYK